jgi:DNA invertase Pin-like site-specific DNA recombinase
MERSRRVLRESAETLRDGFGFTNQRDQCIDFEAKHNLVMVKEHQLVESSSTWNRDKFEAIINEAIAQKDEVPWIVFPRVDRFARNLEAAGYYLGELRRNEIKVGFAEEDLIVDNEASVMSVLMFFVHSFKADQDGRQIKSNMLSGRDRLATERQELPTGMVIWPFDYRAKRLYGKLVTGRPTVNEERAGWVRKWVDWLLNNGIGILEICRRMEQAQIPAPRGGYKWSPATIRRILVSRELIGEFYWKGQLIYREQTNTILAEEQFDALQRRLKEIRQNSYYNAAKLDYPPLRGMVYCQCGRKMVGVPIHGYPYYRCSICRKPLVNANYLWQKIEGKTKAGLLRDDRLIPALKAQFDNTKKIAKLKRELDEKEKAIGGWKEARDKAFRLALVTNYPEDELQKRLVEIDCAKDMAINEKQQIESQLHVLRERLIDEQGVSRFCQFVAENIENLSKEQWRMLLETMNLRITVYGSGLITVNIALPSLPPVKCEVKNDFSRL